eukprot:gene7681-841_t
MTAGVRRLPKLNSPLIIGAQALGGYNSFQPGSLNTYSINWNLVSSTNTAKNLTQDCICNLVPYVCDNECCCDLECPEIVTNTTEQEGRCLPEGEPDQTLTYCTPDSWVQKVNLPDSSDFFAIAVLPVDNQFIDKLLCIDDSRNPDLGENYEDPPAGSAADNEELTQCLAVPPLASLPSLYLLSTPVMVRKLLAPTYQGELTEPLRATPLKLPYPAISQNCDDNFQIGFLIQEPSSQQTPYVTCTRAAGSSTSLQDICSPYGLLSPWTYTSLYYLMYPIVARSGAGNEIPGEVTIQHLGSDGLLMPVTETTLASLTNGTCMNAVHTVNYTISYQAEGTDGRQTGFRISQVVVSIIVTDFDASDDSFTQSMRVNFIEYESTSERLVTPYSGNPGYLSGLPVLSGISTSDPGLDPALASKAISQLVQGFPLPAPGSQGGACSPFSHSPVNYGFNKTSTCSVELSALDLEEYCTGSTGLSQQHFLEPLIASLYDSILDGDVYMGIWGNSNWTSIDQWVKVKVTGYPFNALFYSESLQTCGNVIVGYDITILTGVAFSNTNLQHKVLFVNLCFRTGVWTFPGDKEPVDTHKFEMTSTVRFIPLAQDSEHRTKPAPPLRINLDADIFYPFVTSHATALSAGTAGLALTLALAMFAFLLPALMC